MIRFRCPSCAKQLKADAVLAGRKAKCPKCGASVPIPCDDPAPPDEVDVELVGDALPESELPATTCPHCRGAVRDDSRYAGHDVTCPHCGRAFRMPAGRADCPPFDGEPAREIRVPADLPTAADFVTAAYHRFLEFIGTAIPHPTQPDERHAMVVEFAPVDSFTVGLETLTESREVTVRREQFDGRTRFPDRPPLTMIDPWRFDLPIPSDVFDEVEIPQTEYAVPGSEWFSQCPDCDPAGIARCGECLGGGRITCEVCDGRGEAVCPQCSGSGTRQDYRRVQKRVICACRKNPLADLFPVHCSMCRGQGWIPGEETERHTTACHRCGGRGSERCPSCTGLGTCPCPSCRGRGNVECPSCRRCRWVVNRLSVVRHLDVDLVSEAVADRRVPDTVPMPLCR